MPADWYASRAASTSRSSAPLSHCSPKGVQPMPTMATRSLMPLLAMRVSFGSGIAPPAVAMPPRRGSEASPVEGHHLAGSELDAVEAAHVDHRPGGAGLVA